MTDNVKVKPSTDTSAVRVATDEVDNVHYPVYKHAFGPDGEAQLVDDDNPLPVQQAMTPSQDNTVLLLNDISKKLDILIQYQAMLHKIDLT